jgi:hypothetical protein
MMDFTTFCELLYSKTVSEQWVLINHIRDEYGRGLQPVVMLSKPAANDQHSEQLLCGVSWENQRGLQQSR